MSRYWFHLHYAPPNLPDQTTLQHHLASLGMCLELPVPAHQTSLISVLNLPTVASGSDNNFDFLLKHTAKGWQLQQAGKRAPGPVTVDFASAAASYRRNKGGGELIVKAVAGNKKQLPGVLDTTAGLGGDSFVLASRGYPVMLMERSPIVALLLSDGLSRGMESEDEALREIIGRMCFMHGDSLDYLRQLNDLDCPDVIYIDPMFPASKKSALVKKEMQAFQQLVGADQDSQALLTLALEKAVHRVVVKRPLKAECLGGVEPAFSVKGKAVRFDIYSLKSFSK
jgi:16S rRNA (guanine1516-N2)-methyltransferase